MLGAYSRGGRARLQIKPEIDGKVIRTTNMVRNIYEHRQKLSVSDLAFSAHAYVARALAEAAIATAEEEEIKTVGFSGGVALNEIVSVMIRKIVSDAGLKYVGNSEVPPGDGGVSFGQAYLASF